MAKQKPLIYCILEPLAGASAAWTAYDPVGQRTVVLQFLQSGDAAALDRTEREALAAASISHPGMCRVFDVAEHCGCPFVIREFVEEGVSLRAQVAGAPLPPGQAIEYALEIAAAVEAMHSTAILHRHISAGSIFLSAQGYPKLAGFAFAPAAGQVLDPAATAPELAAGEAGDPRSDLYSVGAVIFEMAAGRPPEPGGAALATLRPDLPAPFCAMVAFLLEAEPLRRFQSAEGLMRALTILRRGSGTVEVMDRLRNLESSRKRRHRLRRRDERWRKRTRGVQVAGTILAVAAIAYLIWLFLPRYQLFDRAVQQPVSTSGDVVAASISPDGDTFAEVRASGGMHSIWRHPAGSGAAVQLVPPAAAERRDLSFSANGKALYYVEGEPDNGVLYKVALEGGAPDRLVSRIVTARISPDGLRAAYVRTSVRDVTVLVGKPDGSSERVLIARSTPGLPNALAWHPNNRMLAVSMYGEGIGANVFTLDTENGDFGQVGWHLWHGRISMAWLPSGDALMVTGPEAGGASPVWRVSYPDGAALRVTRGPGVYSQASLSADGRILVAVESQVHSRVWIAPAGDAAQARAISTGVAPDGVGGLAWTPDGRIVFPTTEGDRRGIWVMDDTGKQRGPLLTSADFASTPVVAPDGRSLVFLWYSGGSPKLWAMDLDGRNVRPVTRGGGEFLPSFPRDGQLLYFVSAVPNVLGVWRMQYENGIPRQLTTNRAVFASVSPDGKLLVYRTDPPDGSAEAIITTADGAKVVNRFPIKEFTNLGWTRESDAVAWPRTADGAGNLWIQPVAGGAARRITNFTSDEMFSFAWSRDYRTLAVARGKIVNNAVLVKDNR